MLRLDDTSFPQNSIYIFGFYFADRRFNHNAIFFLSLLVCTIYLLPIIVVETKKNVLVKI